jgi:hypothetical protein
MGRRHTAGAVGNQAVGGVQVDNTTLTAADNLDITIDPSGTGIFKIAGDTQLQAQGDLRFADSDSSNWVAFQAPSTIAADVTWTLPAADGSSDQVLTTNAAGVLNWTSKSVVISDQTISSSTHYPLFTTSTTGAATGVNVSVGKMSFQPSTGTLTVTAITESSSITLKENINPIENALELILKLTGVVYDRKDGSRKNEAGLIAEDVDKVLPNLVTRNAQGEPEGINYTKLSAYLIEAIKTIERNIQELKRY